MTDSTKKPEWECPASGNDERSPLYALLADMALMYLLEDGYWLLVTPYGVYWGEEGKFWRLIGKRELYLRLNFIIQLTYDRMHSDESLLSSKVVKAARKHILRKYELWRERAPEITEMSQPSLHPPYRTKRWYDKP